MQDQVNALMRSRIQAILDQCQWNSSTPLSKYYADITDSAATVPPADLDLPSAGLAVGSVVPPPSLPHPRSRAVPAILTVLLLVLLVGVVAMWRLPNDTVDENNDAYPQSSGSVPLQVQ